MKIFLWLYYDAGHIGIFVLLFSLQEIIAMETLTTYATLKPDHPLNKYSNEKDLILKLLEELQITHPKKEAQKFYNIFNQLNSIEKRFERKENQLFPFLEGEGWSSQSQRMWSFHDVLRAQFKILRNKIEGRQFDLLNPDIQFLADGIKRLFKMEDEMLFPYSLEKLSENDWDKISQGEVEIGWMDEDVNTVSGQIENSNFSTNKPEAFTDKTHFDEGFMSIEQVNLLFKTMPLDITYVDENDKVIFYNRGEERLFPRSPGIIGREVRYCHPPKSVGTVLRILEEFRKGNRNDASFWINIKSRLIYIRYFAVRDAAKNYRGVVEISQDITEIKNINGEKRLLDWD